ncbi:MAG: GAF domain-containing protein, partial [Bacteroidota bacterium]
MINSEIDQNTRLEELERYAESLTLINEMSQLYNGTEEYDDIFKITASYTPRVLTSAARASITLLDEGGHTFSVFALQGNAAIPLGSRVPLENTAIGEAVGRKELVHENDLNSKDYSDYRLLQEGGLTSAMSMPLINGGKTLGTLNVASQVDFGWRDEKLLEKIGGLLSSSLSSRILFSKLQKAHDQIQKSINYAKRIQTAVLPSEDEIRKYLPESFVLYHPKDVVSGDFYWFSEKDGMIYLAVGDCTGHGVPGCLMSMLGANILSQLIREMK